jgi:hypothetical protein
VRQPDGSLVFHGLLPVIYQFHTFISVHNFHVTTPSLPFMCCFATSQPCVRLKQHASRWN